MEHNEFITLIQGKTGRDNKSTSKLISTLVKVIEESCSDMNTLTIHGFGTFEPKKKREREIVNPSTGNKMLIPPKIVLTYKPSTTIKSKLKDLKPNE